MGRIAELRRQAQRRTSNVYDTLFTRRISIYLTAVLHPLGVSANAVSSFSWFVTIASCALIGLGAGWQVYAGVAGVHLFAVLDSVDGELARLRKTFSLKGLFLEDLCAFTMINGMFLALGGYLARTMGELWPLALAVVTVAFGRNAMQVARRAVLKSVATRRPVETEVSGRGAEAARAPAVFASVRGFVEHHLLHFTNMWIITTTLILVEELGGYHHLHLVLYAFCFFAVAVLLKELAAITTFVFTGALERQCLDVYERARTLPTEPVDGLDLAGDGGAT